MHCAGLYSRAEAEKSTNLSVPPAETYIIEEFDESCPFLKTAFGDRLKSCWQETAFEAFTENRPDFLRSEVNSAQRAIAARLCEKRSTDNQEKIGTREALNSLKALLPERDELNKEYRDPKVVM